MKKFICRNCGAVNESEDAALASSGDWLECALPTGFEWILPTGKITPIVGAAIYVSAHGEHLSRSAYIEKYNIDPERAYLLLRGKVRGQINFQFITSQLAAAENPKKASLSDIGRQFLGIK